jgi:hypothetical protein
MSRSRNAEPVEIFTWIVQQIGLVDRPTARRMMTDWVDPAVGDLLGRQGR